jgi:hypothetical protein
VSGARLLPCFQSLAGFVAIMAWVCGGLCRVCPADELYCFRGSVS